MTGQAYINNKDLSTFGALLTKGAYNALLKACAIKELPKNNSRLQHGTRPIANASTMKVNERTLNLTFWVVGTSPKDFISKYDAFIEEVQKGTTSLKVPAWGKIYNLLYSDCTDFTQYNLKKAKITLKFTEPNPAEREAV